MQALYVSRGQIDAKGPFYRQRFNICAAKIVSKRGRREIVQECAFESLT